MQEVGDEAVARLNGGYVPSVVVQDIVMPASIEMKYWKAYKKINPSIPVIILSAARSNQDGRRRDEVRHQDFLVKPFEEQELELAIKNVVEKQKLKDEVKTLKRQLDSYDAGDMLSTNPKVLKIKEIAKHVADTDVPVLITGESGSGKKSLRDTFIPIPPGTTSLLSK